MKYNNIIKGILFLFFIVCGNDIHSQGNDSLKNIININSEPFGADVFLNSILIGKTPLTLKNQSSGKLEIIIRLDDKNSYSEILQYTGGVIDLYPLFNVDYAILNLVSIPSNASVFLNDSLIGTTSSNEFIIPLGLNKIKIEKEDYLKIERKYNFQKRKYNWNYELTYKYGFLKVDDKGLGINLKVDGKPLEESKFDNYKIPIGEFKFDANLKNGKSVSHIFQIKSNVNHSIVYRTNYFTPIHILQSAILPGVGQYMDDSQLKGLAYFVTTVAFGSFYFIENINYRDNLALYEQSMRDYENALSEEQAILLRTEMEQSLDQVNSSIKKKNIFLGCAIGAYVINLIDAAVFHIEGFDMDLIQLKSNDLGLGSTQIEINYPLN